MKASELMQELQDLLDEHGDCEVVLAESLRVVEVAAQDVHPSTLENVFELWIGDRL